MFLGGGLFKVECHLGPNGAVRLLVHQLCLVHDTLHSELAVLAKTVGW